MFHKILIANRGEIALRIIRTCRELGIRSVLAHSKADAHALPVRLAAESICVGPDDPRGSYLNIPAIISAAELTDSEAIHPGYGFLAENAAFAEVCRACSLTFIGPSPEAIRLMGDKAQARQIAEQAGVPVVPGSEVALKDSAEALEVAERIGCPLIFKAAAGGGGRGMRIVKERAEVVQAFDACQSEAGAAFDSSEVYCEKFIENARHVEVQVLGDRNGLRVHLGERDCSVQRRHQKLVEESPAPLLPAGTREGLRRAALTVAAAVNYVNAGTVEFLVDADGHFYFIEMNARIQVEHPVTEVITGLRSEEHTSELQSRLHLVCRLLLEKKKYTIQPETQLTFPRRIPLLTPITLAAGLLATVVAVSAADTRWTSTVAQQPASSHRPVWCI